MEQEWVEGAGVWKFFFFKIWICLTIPFRTSSYVELYLWFPDDQSVSIIPMKNGGCCKEILFGIVFYQEGFCSKIQRINFVTRNPNFCNTRFSMMYLDILLLGWMIKYPDSIKGQIRNECLQAHYIVDYTILSMFDTVRGLLQGKKGGKKIPCLSVYRLVQRRG